MDASPFKKLPAELRNRIWEATLQLSGDIRIFITVMRVSWRGTKCYVPVALLATCRQIKAEAGGLLYSLNTFHFVQPKGLLHPIHRGQAHWAASDMAPPLKRWLFKIGTANASALTKIKLTVRMPVMEFEHIDDDYEKLQRAIREHFLPLKKLVLQFGEMTAPYFLQYEVPLCSKRQAIAALAASWQKAETAYDKQADEEIWRHGYVKEDLRQIHAGIAKVVLANEYWEWEVKGYSGYWLPQRSRRGSYPGPSGRRTLAGAL